MGLFGKKDKSYGVDYELQKLRIYCDNLLKRIESLEQNYHNYTLNRFDVLEQKINQIKKLDETSP